MTKNEAASVAQLTDEQILDIASDFSEWTEVGYAISDKVAFARAILAQAAPPAAPVQKCAICGQMPKALCCEVLAAPAAPATGESGAEQQSKIDRLKDAIEGECDGLGITDDNARAILAYVDDKSLLEKLWSEARGHMPDGMCGFAQAANFVALLAAKSEAASQPGEMGAPTEDEQQAAFEEWLRRVCPSGDAEAVQRQWEESSDYLDLFVEPASPAASAQQDEREALKHWVNCWDAAEVEGLSEALQDAKSSCHPTAVRLADLIERRIAHGIDPARAALAAQQVQADAGELYRALRAGIPGWYVGPDYNCTEGGCVDDSYDNHTGERLDAAIRAAMSREQSGGDRG